MRQENVMVKKHMVLQRFLNIWTNISDSLKLKPFLQPYTNLNDKYFELLENDFLQYLSESGR